MNKIKQPTGMYILGFTEVFERLSYYTLAYLLVLYASDPVSKGGLGWTKSQALTLSGFYTLAAYTLPVIGGYITDKLLGAFNASVFGAILIILGHATLYFVNHQDISFFFIGISLTAAGTAFFKPSMPTLLGRLYNFNDIRREGGFKLYYMGINIGAIIAGFNAGFMMKILGYRIALSSAGLGMILGLIVFLIGSKYLIKDKEYKEKYLSSNSKKEMSLNENSPVYKKAMKYLAFSFIFYGVWSITYNLTISGTLSLYIENYTQKIIFGHDIQTTIFLSLESIGIIIAAPIFTYLFMFMAKKHRPFHFFSQMSLSLFITLLAISYFTYLNYVVIGGIPAGQRPFSWIGISIFILAVSVSEVLMSPVMMSAISLLSPAKTKTLFQAFYLMAIGIMGLVASKIGSLSLIYPFQTFLSLSFVTLVALVIFLIYRKKMVEVATEAAQELHLNEQKK